MESDVLVKGFGAIFDLIVRLWDWWFRPGAAKRRADQTSDKAVAEGDEKKVNEILDDDLRR